MNALNQRDQTRIQILFKIKYLSKSKQTLLLTQKRSKLKTTLKHGFYQSESPFTSGIPKSRRFFFYFLNSRYYEFVDSHTNKINNSVLCIFLFNVLFHSSTHKFYLIKKQFNNNCYLLIKYDCCVVVSWRNLIKKNLNEHVDNWQRTKEEELTKIQPFLAKVTTSTTTTTTKLISQNANI